MIVFDEFQDATNVDQLEAILRSHIQFHGAVASYVFSGSEPRLMRQLFETKTKPLYGQAEPMRLGRLTDDELVDYIAGRFERTDRAVGDVLVSLLNTARGHPQRAMLLASRLWHETPEGEAATPDRWAAALARTKLETAPEFDAIWAGLTLTEQKTIRAIEETGGTLYRPRTLHRLDLAKPSAQTAIRNLIAKAHVERIKGRYETVDPLLACWVSEMRRRV